MLLGVPPNTLSRWETGATTPDATSLVAVYSVSIEEGVAPVFFRRRKSMKQAATVRTILLTMWDFQNMGVSVYDVPRVDEWIRGALGSQFPMTTRRRYKAFSHPQQTTATDTLANLDRGAWEDEEDADEKLVSHCKADCGQDPGSTILVLITNDSDFADLIAEMKSKGVRVYLLALSPAQELLDAVGQKKWITWPQEIITSSIPRSVLIGVNPWQGQINLSRVLPPRDNLIED